MRKTIFILYGVLYATFNVAYADLSATSFPGTIDDISFVSRVENLTDGYKPFLDKKAYQELEIIPGEEIYTDHMIAVQEAEEEQQNIDTQTMNISEYCTKYPDDETKCESRQDTQITIKPTPQNKYEQTYTPQYSGYTIGGGPVIENNIVTGGSCYPPDHDNNFGDKILTTGKYEHIYPAFEKGLITVFRKEGECGTIKNDPCGYTCYGIGSGSKCSGVTVNSIAEAEDFYHDRYWKKYKIDRLPDVISADIFIACMASGPGTALSQFRKFLGLPKKSSSVDDEMINAVKNYNGDIHNDWMDVRDKFLQDVAHKSYKGSVSKGYKNAIELKRKNGCHVRPKNPIYRNK